MVIERNIFAMLLTHDEVRAVSPPSPSPMPAGSQVLFAMSRDSREAVDAIADAGLAAGGSGAAPGRTTASCMPAPSPISTATSGNVIWMDMAGVLMHALKLNRLRAIRGPDDSCCGSRAERAIGIAIGA